SSGRTARSGLWGPARPCPAAAAAAPSDTAYSAPSRPATMAHNSGCPSSCSTLASFIASHAPSLILLPRVSHYFLGSGRIIRTSTRQRQGDGDHALGLRAQRAEHQ